MGHFSYTCHLTGLPITGGDKAVLLPILPKAHWGYDCSQTNLSKYGLSNLCSNDGPNMYFDELFFPIFGTYDSYGCLENIEKDDNTSVLEEFFGLSIEKIMTVLVDHRKDEFNAGGDYCASVKILDKNNPKHMMLMKASSTWYHRKVYDMLSNIKANDWDDKIDLGTHGILNAIGFEYVGIDKSQDRYKKVYKKDNLSIHSDGTWLNIPNESIYDKFTFKKFCNKNGVDIDIDILCGGKFSQLYDFVLPHVSGIKEFANNRYLTYMLLGDERGVKASQYEIYEDLIFEKLIAKDRVEEIIKLKEELVSNNLTLFYYTRIKSNGGVFLKKNIVDWFNVKQYYYPTGRFLYPVGTAAQDGDFEKVKILLETALSVVNEELIERHYEEDDEDEDED